MICQGSPGTLYVNCICIARRRICSVIRGSWCAGTASGDAILACRAVAVNAIRALASRCRREENMAERMTFPMYAIHRQQTQALWQAVQSLLDERGVMVAGDPPAADPGDLLAHWRQPTLLLSQTCGYPLVTQLPEVQTVGCFHYAAPGCEGRRYRSLLVVREADSHRMLGDFFGRRAVCNVEHSQSGYNVLRKMVAPLSREGRFFSAVMFSGSHRQSLRELQQENARYRRHRLRDLRSAAAPSAAGSGWAWWRSAGPGRARAAADHRRRHPGSNAE